MKYRICVNIPVEKPEEKEILQKILLAASENGAGNVGAYGRVAMILDGHETWRTKKGAHPYNGKIGDITIAKSVRVEMQCPAENVKKVIQTIKNLHPYEEPVIELLKLEEIPQ